MSGMFDVDCPRTPDGDDNKKSNDGKANTSRPPLPSSVRSGSSNVVLVSALPSPSRRLGATTTSSNSRTTTTRRAQFTPRPRGGGGAKRSLGKGIDPEEYIVTPAAMPPPPTTSASALRGHNSTGSAAHHVSVPCSMNPFDVEEGEGEQFFIAIV